MEIYKIIAREDLKCFRCNHLGIKNPTILKDNECFQIHANNKHDFACIDCMDRLLEEISISP